MKVSKDRKIQSRAKPIDRSRAEDWQSVFCNLPIGLAIADFAGRIISVNPCLATLMDGSKLDFKNQPFIKLLHPKYRESFEHQAAKLLSGDIKGFQLEAQIVKRDGSLSWVRNSISLQSSPNLSTSLIIVVQDINDELQAAKVFKRGEERLRAIVTYTTLGISLISLNGSFLDVNPAFATMLGYTQDECHKLKISDVVHPTYLDDTFRNLDQLLSGKLPFFRLVKQYKRKDGTYFWGQSTVSLTRGKDQFPQSIVSITEDISLRMQNEANFRQSQSQLAMAVSVSKIGFYQWHFLQQRVELSDQMAENWGLNSQYLSSAEFFSLIYDRDQSRVRTLIENFVESRQPIHTEFRVNRLDGVIIWVEFRGQYTENFSPEQQVFFGTSIDITERKRIEAVLRSNEEQLRLAEERMRLATDAANLGIWDYNVLTKKLQWSDRSKEIFGLPLEEDVSLRKIAKLYHPEDRLKVEAGTFAALSHPTPARYHMTARVILPNGKLRWVLSRGQTFFEAGREAGPTRFAGTLSDVSDEVRLQEELKAAKIAAEVANQSKSFFLANMSHEIRTPLGAIIGFANLLRNKVASIPEFMTYTNTILRNGQALTRIIDDILDLSKVESGNLEIESIPLSLAKLLGEVTDLFRPIVSEKSINLDLDLSPEVPSFIVSDPARIRQIMVNLIGNAVKFTHNGGITVKVTAEPEESRLMSRITIAVIDTGIGLNQEQISRLFKPFSQADNSTSRKFGGTGLGLHLSKRLAMAIGGDIELTESQPDKGCTFSFSFVAETSQVAELDPMESTALSEPQERFQLNGTRVLIAEDAFDNQLLLRTILSEYGAEVEVANNGIDAVRLALTHSFDVVLMDLQMPDMDGYEATRILRKSGYHRPIIALTAHAMIEERRHTKEVGCDFHLTKPLDPGRLIQTIQHYSRHKPSSVH